jgi:hypothetical protein
MAGARFGRFLATSRSHDDVGLVTLVGDEADIVLRA